MIKHHCRFSPRSFPLSVGFQLFLEKFLFIDLLLLLVFAATKHEDEEEGGGEEEKEDAKPSEEKGEQETKGVGVEGRGGKVEMLLLGMEEESQGVGSVGQGEGGRGELEGGEP